MLEFNKTRHSLYNNLDYLGLNPYEQKHFCFHGSTDGDESGGTSGAEASGQTGSIDFDALSTDPPGKTAAEAEQQAEADARAQDAMSQLEDQLSLAQEEAMSARSAEEKAAGLQDLMDMGIYGYNEAVERGFLEAIEKAERDFDVRQAYEIAEKYGLDPTQVTPAFMDPTGVKTIGYRGPGSTKAAFTEMGRGAARLGANLIEMYPSPLNLLANVAREEFDVKIPSLNLTDKVTSYFDSLAASQKEANIAARGATDPSTAGIIDDVEEEDSEKGAFSSFASPTGFEAPESTYDYGFPDSGGVPLAPPIPSVPTVAPEPAAEVVTPEPRVRTASASNLDILRRIYGDEIADDLIPPRTDLSRIV
tara:strand:- start:195 stop:1283 length:1089 start_codon:yes stop_codon:yes gene_type:complete